MLKILLVEDNRGDQVLFQEALKDAGTKYELSLLERADQIVNFVEKLQPQLIFMDVMLSGVTGGDAVRLLKHNIHTKDIPVVFLTGIYGSGDELKGTKGIQIDGHNYPALAKPVAHQRLQEVINNIKV